MTSPSLGSTIAQRRKQKSLTQFELAEKMDVSDKAVSKWERDLSCPDIESFAQLAEILELSADELLSLHTTTQRRKITIGKYFRFGLTVVGVVCGVVVAALALLGQLDMKQFMVLLGIGLASVSIATLDIVDDVDDI